MKRKKELQDQINAENKILRQGANERQIIEATDAKEAEDKAKEAQPRLRKQQRKLRPRGRRCS
jgi:hypothetical protein